MQTFFTNCRLVDGTGQAALEAATVVVSGATIGWCGAAQAADAPTPQPDDRVVDLGGKTIVPGLFNTHVHLALRLPFPERRIDQFDRGYRVMLVYRRALEAIYSGTTTIRCVGEAHYADMDVRNAINKGVLAGPQLQSAGHADCHGRTWPQFNGMYGGRRRGGFQLRCREQLRAGADLVKICLTGGIGTPGENRRTNRWPMMRCAPWSRWPKAPTSWWPRTPAASAP
ncbi:MAG: hypothetical protein R2911_45495 [Caldilineaceae bacterium]